MLYLYRTACHARDAHIPITTHDDTSISSLREVGHGWLKGSQEPEQQEEPRLLVVVLLSQLGLGRRAQERLECVNELEGGHSRLHELLRGRPAIHILILGTWSRGGVQGANQRDAPCQQQKSNQNKVKKELSFRILFHRFREYGIENHKTLIARPTSLHVVKRRR